MCSSKPPTPQAPPAPIPVRDEKIDARMKTQEAARRASASGYQSTMLSGGSTQSPGSAPVLGS